MLVTLKQILNLCEAKKCAVGSFNTPNLEAVMAVIGAAEELDVPVIIQHAQAHEEIMPMDVIVPIMLEMAKKAKVPVCVHLDHGETLEYVCRALDLGVTSVMYDGSVLPFEENLANTQMVVSFAKQTGASVEAEIGCMGKPRSAAWGSVRREAGRQVWAKIRKRSIQIRIRRRSLSMQQGSMRWLVPSEQHTAYI